MLRIVVRAIDYLPVLDVNFGDVVRALVTADRRLFPADAAGIRSAIVEALRQRGIYPSSIRSLADESLPWPGPSLVGSSGDLRPLRLSDQAMQDVQHYVSRAVQDLDLSGQRSDRENAATEEHRSVKSLAAFVRSHAPLLGFEPDRGRGLFTQFGVSVAFRQAEDGQPLPDLIIQLTQRRRDLEDLRMERAGWEARAATVVVAKLDGTIEHLIVKPLPFADVERLRGQYPGNAPTWDLICSYHAEGNRRLQAMRERLSVARLEADHLGADSFGWDTVAFADLDEPLVQGRPR